MRRQILLLLVATGIAFAFGSWRAARAQDAGSVFTVGGCVQVVLDASLGTVARQPMVIAVTAVNGTWVKTKSVPQGNIFNSGAWLNTEKFITVTNINCESK